MRLEWGAGSCGREWGEVVGSSWSGGGVVRMGEKGASDESLPPSPIYDRYQSKYRYHAVPPPYTRTFIPPKPDLVFHNAPNVNETVHTAFNAELSLTKPNTDLSSVKPVETSILASNLMTAIPKSKSHGNNMNSKACFVCKSLTYLIKDCDYHEQNMAQTPARNHAPRGNHQKYARMTLSNPQRHVVPTTAPMVNAVKGVQGKWEWKPKCLILDHVSQNTSASLTLKRGNPQHDLKDKGVINSGYSRHMTGNMSYFSDFKELNGGYVAFGGNLKGGKISGKGKSRTGKLDFDDVYFVKELKFNLFSVLQMCDKKNNVLFTYTECIILSPEFKLPDENQAEAVNTAWYVQNGVLLTKPQNKTPYELLLGRTPSIGFMRPFDYPLTILNTLDPFGKFDGKVDEEFLVGYSNTDGDATFEDKEPEFEGRKPESAVYVSSSSSAQSKKHDDKTKREAKGKSLVESLTGYRNLKDITYSGDEEDVGVEADFTNLESTITINPILTTRVHKVHPVTQIIGDLSSATQTRKEGIDYEEVFASVARIEAIRLFLANATFMGFMMYQMDVKSAFLYGTIKEEVYVCQPLGFEDPAYPDKVYKVVKALYGLHQAPRAWYETLANYLLENGFQRGKIDLTLFIKRQKGNILLVQIYVDDFIFGSTNKDLCKAFEKLMKEKFQMSSMGKLTFLLGLQVKQNKIWFDSVGARS
nr:putative ribonuclease H-like domain-containing protein [Tanacetum cinerariifolium]